VTAYIDGHRERFGVEPICAVLRDAGVPIAPSTYYAARSRPPSARARRDEWLSVEITNVWKDNYEVFGARKVWQALRRREISVARCTVERLMRELGITGATRGKAKRTTVPAPDGVRAGDLVNRRFTAERPNALWVADFTYVATRSGTVYVAFVIDVFSRRMVGWKADTRMRTGLVPDALEMACGPGTTPVIPPGPAWSTTPTRAASTPRSTSPTTLRPPASTARSARSGTPTTTPWPSPRSASTRPN
jgi:putative transposase